MSLLRALFCVAPFIALSASAASGDDPHGLREGQLLASEGAPGQTLAQFIFWQYSSGAPASGELGAVLESVGFQLRAFHSRYGAQHGDLSLSSVVVDVSNRNRVSFVAPRPLEAQPWRPSWLPAWQGDVASLVADLRHQSAAYHPDAFLEHCVVRLEHGYNSASGIYDIGPPAWTMPWPKGDVWDLLLAVDDHFEELLWASLALLAPTLLLRLWGWHEARTASAGRLQSASAGA